MNDLVCRVIEVVGSSDRSSDDAIRNALDPAGKTVSGIGWFKVLETRGHVSEDKVSHSQVTVKLRCTLDDCDNG